MQLADEKLWMARMEVVVVEMEVVTEQEEEQAIDRGPSRSVGVAIPIPPTTEAMAPAASVRKIPTRTTMKIRNADRLANHMTIRCRRRTAKVKKRRKRGTPAVFPIRSRLLRRSRKTGATDRERNAS